jgi:hypothetical protein
MSNENKKLVENDEIKNLKKELNFIHLDERLEMIKIPTLSALSCQKEPNSGCDTMHDNACGPPKK